MSRPCCLTGIRSNDCFFLWVRPFMDFDERIIPDRTEKGILSVHLKRYDFARARCAGLEVLDIGCGAGYGSAYLAQKARQVKALDTDSEAIGYARAHYQLENLEFQVADAGRLPFGDMFFDRICSFEVIEHLDDPERCLAEAGRALKKNGIFFISTPWIRRPTQAPLNPHHKREWSHPDFKEFLEKYFSDVQIFWQVRKQTPAHRILQKLDFLGLRKRIPLPAVKALARTTGTSAFSELSLADMEISREFSDNPLSQIAVCTKPK